MRPKPQTTRWPLELLQSTLHALPPEHGADLARDHGPDELGRRVERREDAAEGEAHREEAPGGAHRVHLEEPDGGDRDDRHVERVEEAPALDEPVAGRAGHHEAEEHGERHQQATEQGTAVPQRAHRARVARPSAHAAIVAGQGGARRTSSRPGADTAAAAGSPLEPLRDDVPLRGRPVAALEHERGPAAGRGGERAGERACAGARAGARPRPRRRERARSRPRRPLPARPRRRGPPTRRGRGRPRARWRSPNRRAPSAAIVRASSRMPGPSAPALAPWPRGSQATTSIRSASASRSDATGASSSVSPASRWKRRRTGDSSHGARRRARSRRGSKPSQTS